jgi:hypothetical protein
MATMHNKNWTNDKHHDKDESEKHNQWMDNMKRKEDGNAVRDKYCPEKSH